MPFQFTQLEIPGLVLVETSVMSDERGYFFESYKKSVFEQNGMISDFVQDNYSVSRKGVIRGLHYQIPPQPQGKLIRVIRGSVWDVAVDVRRDSPFFLKWIGVELSAEKGNMLFIPGGFAHGFAALCDDVHMLYKCTSEYSPLHERGINWADPNIGIQWPVQDPIVSARDRQLPTVQQAELFN